MDAIKKYIDECTALLPTEKAVSEREAERRAGQFLHIQAHLVNEIDILSDDKIKALSLQSAVFSELISSDRGKNVTEKKIAVEAHPDYEAAREALEGIENDISYLKSFLKIFENAHVFYRQMSRMQ